MALTSQYEGDSQTPATTATPAPKVVQRGTKLTTGVCRASYLTVFKPKVNKDSPEGTEPKYSVTLLIPKTDTVTLEKIRQAQENAAKLKFTAKMPAKLHYTLHDGDLPKESDGEAFGEECKGHFVIAVASKYKPKVVDLNNDEIIDPSELVSGDYIKASLNFYGFDFKGKKGVSAGLGNILFIRKGDPLGSSSRPEDDFAEDFAGQ